MYPKDMSNIQIIYRKIHVMSQLIEDSEFLPWRYKHRVSQQTKHIFREIVTHMLINGGFLYTYICRERETLTNYILYAASSLPFM